MDIVTIIISLLIFAVQGGKTSAEKCNPDKGLKFSTITSTLTIEHGWDQGKKEVTTVQIEYDQQGNPLLFKRNEEGLETTYRRGYKEWYRGLFDTNW